MGFKSGNDVAYVFVGGVDVKPSNSSLGVTTSEVIAQRRPLGSVYKRSLKTGQYDSGLTLSGWVDTDTLPMLGDIAGTSRVVSAMHEGNVAGDRFFGFEAAKVSGMGIGFSDEDIDALTPTIVVDGAFHFGYVVGPYASRSTAGNTDAASAALGASAASGTAFLHVGAIALGGYTNCILTVRHSSDNITFTNHTAFVASTAIGAQVLALPSTVNKYVSIGWAWTGSGSGQSISAFVGVAVD